MSLFSQLAFMSSHGLLILQILAFCAAGVAGFLVGQWLYGVARANWERMKRERKDPERESEQDIRLTLLLTVCRSIEREREGRGQEADSMFRESDAWHYRLGKLRRLIDQAGLEGLLDPEVVMASRLRFAGGFGILLALVGMTFSGLFAFGMLFLGAVLGWRYPEWVIARKAEQVRTACNGEVPIMLDIIALSSRAGMSFDRAFQLYTESFSSPLAKRCEMARISYTQGITSRSRALDELARRLESLPLEHFAQTVNQATHFGVPLSDALEELARQIRQEEKAGISEKVSKAPVKMLIPMGLFILPAMLLLVMGPIVLNMLVGLS